MEGGGAAADWRDEPGLRLTTRLVFSGMCHCCSTLTVPERFMPLVSKLMPMLSSMGGTPYMAMIVAEEVTRGRVVQFMVEDGEIRYV